MKIGEGKFHRKSQILYVPKAAVTALDLSDGDIVEYHVEGGGLKIRKAKLENE